MGRGILKTAESGIETVGAIIDGDTDKAIKVGKEMVKTAAIGALSLGVLDVIDGIADGIDVDGDGDTSVDTYDGWVQHNPDYRV